MPLPFQRFVYDLFFKLIMAKTKRMVSLEAHCRQRTQFWLLHQIQSFSLLYLKFYISHSKRAFTLFRICLE